MKISFGWDESGEPTVRVNGEPVARACDCPGYSYVQAHVLAYQHVGADWEGPVEIVVPVQAD